MFGQATLEGVIVVFEPLPIRSFLFQVSEWLRNKLEMQKKILYIYPSVSPAEVGIK